MKELIERMQHADTWTIEDISWILSAYNQEIGDRNFFKELIHRAHEAKIIEAVFVPTVRSSTFEDRLVFSKNNFDYKALDVRNWVKSKEWQWPPELGGLKLHNDFNGIKLENNEDILLKSPYWKNFKKIVLQAIKEYPAWEKTQRKVQKTKVVDWLCSKGIPTREAEIIKTILSDFFEKLQ